MSVIGGQNPIVQNGLVYILDFGNQRSYVSGSSTAQSLVYSPVTASFVAPLPGAYSGLAAAYSVRKVVPGYTGYAMEVQSGSVSASIGFDSFGNLDTASLESFAGSGDAFVKTWYDQSGKNNHAITIADNGQPRIVHTGSMELLNGKPSLYYDNSDEFRLTNTIEPGQQLAIIGVSKVLANAASGFTSRLVEKQLLFGLFDAQTSNNYYPAFFIRSGGTYTAEYQDNRQDKTSLLYGWADGTSVNIAVNSNTGSTVTYSGNIDTSTRQTHIGAYLGTYSAFRYNSEILIYTSSNAQNRTFIENNINTYYNIYTGSNDGFVPGLSSKKLEFTTPTNLSTNQSFPGFSYNQGNATLIFTGQPQGNSTFIAQDGTVAVSATTSSIGYGSSENNLGRTFPISDLSHVSLRFTTGSVDCFVDGIPTAPDSIFPSGSGTNFEELTIPSYTGSLGNLLVYNRELTDDEIYAIYLQQARRYGLPEAEKPYTVDSSVYAYTQAAGITGSSVITALDAFVVGLKANNLWNKMIAIYPFLGSDTTKTRYNLKDPSLNTTAITYLGSWSASDSGSYNNNTSSYGIMENIKGDYYHPLISSESIHLSYLSYDTQVSGGYLIGVEQIPGLPGDIAAPAAAYSVRKVRTAYTGSALRVRRDSDDLSFDVGFDASGNLDTGSLLTRMTASLNTPALPGDYSGLAAAYSLRRVSSSYSGYVIEVRKASTNASASIGFDGSGNLNTASLASFIRTGSEVPVSTYSGLAAAYSLRKVVPTYGGSAIEIRSGSVSQSIGFNSFGDLDIAVIRTFAGSGDAFVKTWFDQSGNGYHATQSVATAQPKIYSGSQGSVIYENGKPAMAFDGIDDFLESTDSVPFVDYTTLFFAFRSNLNRNIFHITSPASLYVGHGQGITDRLGIFNNNAVGWKSTSNSITGIHTLGYVGLKSTGYEISANGILSTGAGATPLLADTNSLLIAARKDGSSVIQYTDGVFQEVLVYNTDQTANRTYIENNINSYYGIYTPTSVSTENAFVKTWYDQSGNNNHVTQSDVSRQPQIVNNGAVMTENGKPAITFTSDFLQNSTLLLTQPFTFFGSFRRDAGTNIVYDSNGGARSYLFANPTWLLYSGTSLTSTDESTGQLLVTTFHSSSISKIYVNNGIISTGDAGTQGLGGLCIGSNNGSSTYFQGSMQELIFYNSDQTSNRNRIEDNINGYYNIFTYNLELGSGYVTTWYDQSGNNRHATQSVAASQPLILSSGSIVTERGKSALSFNGVSNYLQTTLASTIPQPVSIAMTHKYNTSNNDYRDLIDNWTLSGNRFLLDTNTTYRLGAGSLVTTTLVPTTNQTLLFAIYNGNTSQLAINSNNQTGINPGTNGLTSFSIGATIGLTYLDGLVQEVNIYPSNQSSNKQPIEQNTNTYFNIYTPPAYNQNLNSLSLFSSPTLLAGAANASPTQLTTGGPTGLITVSRTGSSDYTLWKNRVPTKTTLPASTPLSNEIYLNAANLDNAFFSASQNNVSYASVGAGLTDDEVYTYYELVDDLQTSLNRGVVDPTAFITTWDTRISGTGTVTGTSSIALPLFGTQAITASWGDGTVSLISQSLQNDRIHTYATPGVYTVSITGTGQGFQFNNGGDRAKLLDIGQWGSISGSTSGVFYGCSNLVGTAADSLVLQSTGLSNYFRTTNKFNGYINDWDTSKVTNMSSMFQNSIFNQELNRWNVSSVTDISLMFRESSFNKPLSNWNTGLVTNMSNMFFVTSFNQNIGSWDVSKVTNMSGLFNGASLFNNSGSSDINNWRPISCSNFSSMFSSATAFNQPIGNWTIGTGSQIPLTGINMTSMFNNADAFNQNIGAWNVEKVTNMSSMFNGNRDFNNSGSADINNWRPISCSNFSSMFESATAFNQPIGNWPLSASNIDMSSMFNRASTFNQDISTWDTSRVINMNTMFGGFGQTNTSIFNQPVGSWDVSSVTTMFYMFAGAYLFNQDLGNWDMSSVTTIRGLFYNATAFNNSGSDSINNWDTSNVTNMGYVFHNATSFNQPIGNWNLGKVTNFDFMWVGKTSANYSYLHTIYDGWINNKLQPQRTITFNTIKYSGSAAQGRALLTRTYNTASIIGSNDDTGQIAITCSANHNVVAGNKIFISGSSYTGINGVRIVDSTGSSTTLTIQGVPYDPAATDGLVITGYGWSITDGGVV